MTARTRRRQARRGRTRMEVDDDNDGNDKEVQTEAEGIVTWHGRRRTACVIMQCGPLLNYINNIKFRIK